MTTRQTMLDAYTKALDWLQFGERFDEDCAAAALAVLSFQKEELRKFKSIGTDSCRRCTDGRVSIFKASEICLECESGFQPVAK